MKHLIYAAAAIVAVTLCTNEADACRRCGNLSRCRYAVTTYAAPVVKAVKSVATDVYVVQNNYPQPLVAQGTTQTISTGGYQSAVLPLLDPNQYFATELQLIKAAGDTNALRMERSAALFERVMELQAPATERLAAGHAAKLVLEAAGLSPKGVTTGSSSAVVINRDSYGRVQILPLDQQQVAEINGKLADPNIEEIPVTPPADAPGAGGGDSKWPTLNRYCGKCHGTALAQPKASLFLGDDPNVAATMRTEFFNIVQQIKSGSMPPADAPQPSDEERAAIVNEIEAIINSHTQ